MRSFLVWSLGLKSNAERYEDRDRALLSIVFRKIGRRGGRSEPEATMARLDRFDGDPSCMDRARRASLVAWGRQSPGAALDWAYSRSSSRPHPKGAADTILFNWFGEDRSALLVWLRQNAPADLDAILSRLAIKAVSRAPEDTPSWVELIQDEEGRRETVLDVGARWYAVDEVSAEAFLTEMRASPGGGDKIRDAADRIREEGQRGGPRADSSRRSAGQ